MATKLLIAAFLVAHGVIHATFLAPRPPVTAGGPSWPFELGRSWLLRPLGLDAKATRTIGTVLIVLTIAAFVVAGLAAAGLAPDGLWPASATLGAVASIAVLGLYLSPWFVVGVAIDLVLLWAVLVQAWTPDAVAP